MKGVNFLILNVESIVGKLLDFVEELVNLILSEVNMDVPAKESMELRLVSVSISHSSLCLQFPCYLFGTTLRRLMGSRFPSHQLSNGLYVSGLNSQKKRHQQ